MRPAARKKRRKPQPEITDPYQDMWLALSPAERLRRSWRMRSRVKNLQALHDAKLPEL